MSITVKFDGKYQNTIHVVTPLDVKIIGKRLSVKGSVIPINEDIIFETFKVIERAANSPCGTLFIEIRANGTARYCDETSSHGIIDWGLGKILGFGTSKSWSTISNYGFPSMPKSDTYMVGQYKK